MGVFDVWLGPLLAGTLATVFLLGFVLLEGRAYFRSSKKDGIWLKLLVCYIILAELFITAALIALIWMFLIDDFDNPFALLTTPWMLHAEPLLAACVSLPVQLFFAQRVVILYHRPWFGVGIGAVSIIIFGLGVVITVLLSHNTDALLPTNINNLIHDIGAVAISLHLVNDVIISGSLVWYLHTNRTGIQRSDMLIDDIVRLTIQTGSLTALVVIVLLILNSAYMGNQSNSMSAIAYMPLSKFYSLSLLVTLNARQGWSFGSTNSRMWDTAAVAAQMSGLGPTNAPGAGDAMAANGDIHLPPGIVAIIPSSPDIERRAGEEL
ncbi:hypothetical protein DL93DRAFT_1402570 [Clavulina sp. PMI_390]|nr:hypothetical protein DL93DRAFT_1402570 [Clavulina sp. PMI_390]